MGKLLRSLKGENVRLYSNSGPLLALIAVFLISVCVAWVIGANSGKDSLLPSAIADEVNELPVSVPKEQTIETEETIQQVITDEYISDSSMISGSDVSESDKETTKIVVETRPFDSWNEAYRARYEELTDLNEEYTRMAENHSGREKGYYIAKQQEVVREAYIINACLKTGKEMGYSAAWNVVYLTLWLMLLPIGIFAAAAIASKTAGEYKSGVIYTLYTLPVTRMKQYFAKLMSVSLFAVLMCAVAWTGSVFGAMMGCGGLAYVGEYIRVLGESAKFESFFAFSLELLVCTFITSLILVAFSAAVSTLTRSQSTAVALTAVLCIAAMVFGKTAGGSGNILVGLSVVSVLDVSAPLRGVPNFASAGYGVSWLAAAVYWLVFIICGYLGMRRDVR